MLGQLLAGVVTIGLALGLAAALLIAAGLGWRVAAMFDRERPRHWQANLTASPCNNGNSPRPNTRGERRCRQLSS